MDFARYATKMNRGMTHQPNYYNSLKKYQHKTVFQKQIFTKKEEQRLNNAKRKRIVTEVVFCFILIGGTVGGLYIWFFS